MLAIGLEGRKFPGTKKHVGLYWGAVIESFQGNGDETIWLCRRRYMVFLHRRAVGMVVDELYPRCVKTLETKRDK